MPGAKHLAAIRRAEIKRRSGFDIPSHASIEHLREGYFRKVNKGVAGDAPKDFLRIYTYGEAHKIRSDRWPAYIAKVGQKWYPNESVTEHLLTRIGQLLGLNIAASRLMWVRGQLRFLSRYFLREDESLVHGAEMFAGYLADKEFVDQVAQMNLDRELFTFQVVTAAMKNQFPDQADLIMHDFVRLLGFDAVVGNNDRHFFNWGVITQISGDRPPRFSPIFDTARALCWNIDEAGLEKAERNFETFLRKYAEGCYPKTGWDGLKSPNHFEIMRKIVSEHIEYWDTLGKLAIEKLPELVQELLDNEFEGLMSERRKRFIVACLERRMHYFIKAITI